MPPGMVQSIKPARTLLETKISNMEIRKLTFLSVFRQENTDRTKATENKIFLTSTEKLDAERKIQAH